MGPSIHAGMLSRAASGRFHSLTSEETARRPLPSAGTSSRAAKHVRSRTVAHATDTESLPRLSSDALSLYERATKTSGKLAPKEAPGPSLLDRFMSKNENASGATEEASAPSLLDKFRETQEAAPPASSEQAGGLKLELPKVDLELPAEAPSAKAPPAAPERPVEVPQPVEAPKPDVPAVDLPKADAPKLELPDVDLPKFDMPKFEDMPKFDMPKFGMPKLDMPKLDMPKLDLPEVSAPEGSLPQGGAAEGEATSAALPDLEAPKLDLPEVDVSKLGMPKFSMPDVDMPKLDMPKFSMPSLDMPKLDLPKFGGASEAPKDDAPAAPAPAPAPQAAEESAPSASSAAAEVTTKAAEVEAPAKEAATTAKEAPAPVKEAEPAVKAEAPVKDAPAAAPEPPAAEASSAPAEPAAASAPETSAASAPATPEPAVPAPESVPPASIADALPNADAPAESSGIAKAINGVEESLSGAVSGVTSSVQEAFSGVLGVVKEDIDIVREDIEEGFGGVASQVDSMTGGVVGKVADQISAIEKAIEDAVAGALGETQAKLALVITKAEVAIAQGVDTLPQPTQGVAKFVTSLIGASVELVRALPYGDFILVGTAVGLPIYLWYDKEFGGYSGKMGATKCLQLMSKGRAVLIDTRDERVRAREGIPKLRRRARQMAVAVPGEPLESELARLVRTPGQLELDIHAVRILGLKGLSEDMSIVVMGPSESNMIALARTLRRMGVRQPYVLDGGFRGWKGDKLEVLDGTTAYEGGTIRVIADDVEYVAEEARVLLSDPWRVAGIVGGLGASALLLYDWKSTLQFVGVLGIQLSIVKRLSEYNNSQEFIDDVVKAWRTARGVATAMSDATGKVAGATGKVVDVAGKAAEAVAKKGAAGTKGAEDA